MRTKSNWMNIRTGILRAKFIIALIAIAILYSCGNDDGDAVAPEGTPNVRIVEVDAAADEVTLSNFGDADADLTDYWFCLRRSYTQFSVDATSANDLILGTGESITFSIVVDDASSDVAIYNTGGAFASSDAMVDFMQFNGSFSSNGRESVAVEKGIWTAGEFVEGATTFTYGGNGDQNGAAQWSGDAIPQESNVRIVSVDPINDLVQLKNFGGASQDLSGYFFCLRKTYPGLSTLTPTSGDLTLDPDEEIEFPLTIVDGSSDIALYRNNSGFANADNMLDFMQFGDDIGTAGRVNVAVEAGKWEAGNFVNGVGPYSYSDSEGLENGASQWTASEAGAANVRIVSVNPANDLVTLENFGTATSDLAGWFFCRRKAYQNIGGLTPSEGNLYLAPGESVEFSLTVDDASSDVGLYRNNSGFANPENMLDFMQFGDAIGDAGRETVAVAAGLWTAGDFVNGVGPFTYGDATGAANGADQWSPAAAGAANVRMSTVDATNDKVTLKNFGTASLDISGWWFCRRKSYAAFTSIAPANGNYVLAPGEEIEFDLTIDETSSDVGVYNQGGAFANPAAIVDFMQFGADVDAAGREDVAVSAGIWTVNEFVPNPGPFSYDGDGTQNGASFWNQ